MKKLTAKQRAKIYRQAAEMIFSRREYYCCRAIAGVLGFDRILYSQAERNDKALELSPELQLFNPNNGDRAWWDCEEIGVRVIALLFSREIAFNP